MVLNELGKLLCQYLESPLDIHNEWQLAPNDRYRHFGCHR
jgi:hypothetical protein